MPNIYITNRGCHDFTAAEAFGTLIDLTKGKYNLLSLGRMHREMEPLLRGSTPDDYLLVCGPTIMNMVAAIILFNLHKRLNLLIYVVGNDGVGRYKRRNLIIGEE